MFANKINLINMDSINKYSHLCYHIIYKKVSNNIKSLSNNWSSTTEVDFLVCALLQGDI